MGALVNFLAIWAVHTLGFVSIWIYVGIVNQTTPSRIRERCSSWKTFGDERGKKKQRWPIGKGEESVRRVAVHAHDVYTVGVEHTLSPPLGSFSSCSEGSPDGANG